VDLLCNDAEHLQVDAVELIKTRPGPTARQTLEKLALQQQQPQQQQSCLGAAVVSCILFCVTAASGKKLAGSQSS
jgi:hypothetical protein